MTDTPPQLYLITPAPVAGRPFAPVLSAALAGGGVACVLVTEPSGIPDHALADLVRVIQSHGAAALLAEDWAKAKATGADGVHAGTPQGLSDAIRRLKPDGIVGAGSLTTRDDAMMAGESGADYVMLGDDEADSFDARLDRVAWWAEIFQVPCVALARDADEIAPLAATGAEFIGLGDVVWRDPEGPAAAMAKARQAVATGHAAHLARQAEFA